MIGASIIDFLAREWSRCCRCEDEFSATFAARGLHRPWFASTRGRIDSCWGFADVVHLGRDGVHRRRYGIAAKPAVRAAALRGGPAAGGGNGRPVGGRAGERERRRGGCRGRGSRAGLPPSNRI